VRLTVDNLVLLGALALDKRFTVSVTPLGEWAMRRPYTVSKAGEPVAALTVTLLDTQPPIWRHVLVPAHIRLDRLHDVIQAAMGWQDSHLHVFSRGADRYGLPDDEAPDEQDERAVSLDALLVKEGDSMLYEYDFGDGWEHDITLDELLTATADGSYPRCVGGERACPPEDCGGTSGYEELIETLADRKHPDHKDMREWMGMAKGATFDPARFDLAEANARLDAAVRVRRRLMR
jgi:hypothetical protein